MEANNPKLIALLTGVLTTMVLTRSAWSEEVAYQLTESIAQVGNAELPPDTTPKSILKFSFPHSGRQPEPVLGGCSGERDIFVYHPLEQWIEEFEQDQLLLPIERYIEYFGMPAAPPLHGRFAGPAPPDTRISFAAALVHRKKCDQATCELFYVLFPSLPQMPKALSVPLPKQLKEQIDQHAALQLLEGWGDCIIESGDARPVTPIEQFLAQGLSAESEPIPDEIRSPSLDRIILPNRVSPPARVLNWVLAGPDSVPAPIQRRPDITNHLAN